MSKWEKGKGRKLIIREIKLEGNGLKGEEVREEIEVWKTIVVEGEGSAPMAFVQDPSATQWVNETMFNLLKQAISWSGAEGKQVYQDISTESGQIQVESKTSYQAINRLLERSLYNHKCTSKDLATSPKVCILSSCRD